MEVGFINLRISCIIGIFDYEREHEQIIEADVSVEIDASTAVQTENIDDSVSYSDLAQMFSEHARNGKYLLLETMAEEFRIEVSRRYPLVRGGAICIRKPSAIRDASAGFVRLKW